MDAPTRQERMKLGVLAPTDYERWRFGEVDYLERVCKVNLGKLSYINSLLSSRYLWGCSL